MRFHRIKQNHENEYSANINEFTVNAQIYARFSNVKKANIVFQKKPKKKILKNTKNKKQNKKQQESDKICKM